MKTEDFLYNDFTLIAHYDHIEAEPETGFSEHVEVQEIEYHTSATSINITPFVSEFCDNLFEDFADKIKNDGQRDFRSESKKNSDSLFHIFGNIQEDLKKITDDYKVINGIK